ncbi:MAG: methylmalonyl-CoA carboxyltransferase [Ruminococcaceae bacterium]|nr:methylmalonyl-CoA carboxyltransferase [Oscillospiraceae bacterium]
MSTNNKLVELHNRRTAIEAGGGTEKTTKQHDAGKLTARERINLLFDEGSFIELDAFAGARPSALSGETEAPCDGVICGYGTVELRPVFAYAQDFTVLGGSVGEIHGKKIAKVIDMAVKTGAPIVGMLDSGGARIQEGTDALEGMGLIMRKTALASGVVPQIAAVMGPCAGGAAAAATLSDFVFMTREASTLYVSGPSVIKGTTGVETTAKELGGAEANAEKSGNCQVVCDNDEALIAAVKALLSYLPSNNLEDAPLVETDDINRISPALNGLIPDDDNAGYDVKSVLAEIADSGSLYEILPLYAKNIVTAFGRMGGATVGFVASQAAEGGQLDGAAAEKATRFVRFCDAFNLPVITLTDTDGYKADVAEEQSGLARKMAALAYAYAEATVPKLNLILRKAYGSAYIAMGSKHIGADMTYAWPTAQIAVMHAEGAAGIIYRKELQKAEDPIKARGEFVEAFKETFANPYEAAKHGYVDDVIEPDSTRPRLIAALLMLAGKREVLPAKKHGSMPL